jgi:prepilin-type N-terminal cleavage/methylation domain-containing protein/prepilin-type processing-associated H-X9-DG protein
MVFRRSGFTLMELLLVILVISMLAALLFPVFAAARRDWMRQACMNNLRQLAAAVLLYAENNDGCAPGVEHPWAQYTGGGWPENKHVAWQVLIEPYVSDMEVYCCPAEPYWCLVGSWGWPGMICMYGVPMPDSWQGVSVGYAMNPLLQLSAPVGDTDCSWWNWDGMCNGEVAPWDGWGGQNLQYLAAPQQVLMLSDGNNLGENCGDKVNWASACGTSSEPECSFDTWGMNPDYFGPEHARHKGGNNWAFADGSVRWVRSELFLCAPGGYSLTDKEIQKGRTMQLAHGVDQMN